MTILRGTQIWLLAIFALVVGAAIPIGKWASVPPVARTVGAISLSMQRILEFAYDHNRLPLTLEELPDKKGYTNHRKDGWNRPLDFQVDMEGTITLRSLGADRKVGGDGDDRDIAGVFRSKDDQGRWAPIEPRWIVDPTDALQVNRMR